MLSRTAVAMPARADFVVETAVNLRISVSYKLMRFVGWWFTHLVLFCSENGGEIVRHDEWRKLSI